MYRCMCIYTHTRIIGPLHLPRDVEHVGDARDQNRGRRVDGHVAAREELTPE